MWKTEKRRWRERERDGKPRKMEKQKATER